MSFSNPPPKHPLDIPPDCPPHIAKLFHDANNSRLSSDKTRVILVSAIRLTTDEPNNAMAVDFLTRALNAHEYAVKADTLVHVLEVAREKKLPVERGVRIAGRLALDKLQELLSQLQTLGEELVKEKPDGSL
jgi:hypothetical protein